jgi:hypothetical protein
MNITRQLHLWLTIGILGCAALTPALFGQATPPIQALPPIQTTPAERQGKTIPTLKIRSGPLVAAVDELCRTLEAAHLPEMNVIYAPEARTILVPDLVLRNVTGPDALRLITVSAGCEMTPIPGSDDVTIGFHVFAPAQGAPGSFRNPELGAHTGFADPSSGPTGAGQVPGLLPGSTAPGSPAPPQVMGFGGIMAAPNASNSVRVYSLGGITNTTKFPDVEATLRDVLKADGVSADAAKLAFHEHTNVLVVTADSRVHDLVTQYLEALQKNVAVAMAEEKRGGGDRREAVEALIRLNAEREQRERVTKQLAETEALLREAQRELDRTKAAVPKPQ